MVQDSFPAISAIAHFVVPAYARLIQKHDSPHTLGFAERFVAPGFVPGQDFAELMIAAEALVFPSLAEGFGMPNVEAMARSEAMHDVSANEQLHARLIERGAARISLFSWTRSAERLLSVYKELSRG